MARFWFTGDSPTYTPPTVRGTWAVSAGHDIQYLGRMPSGSAGTSSINVGATTANRDVLLHRSISDAAIKAGTLSGTAQWVIGARESAAGLNGHIHLHVYVTSGSTDTPRGTLLSNFIGTNVLPTAAQGTTETAQTVTPVAVSVGDRIVVEIGYRASATAATQNATIHYGNTGTDDLAAAGTGVTSAPGWIEFSGANGLFTTSLGDLVDDFAAGSFSAQWTASAGTSVTGGRARINATTAFPSLQTAVATYELTGTALAFQVPTVPGPAGVMSAYLWAGASVNSTNLEFFYNANAGQLVLMDNGGATGASTMLTYSATDHQWWRFREASGSVLMETSPDNVTWTTRRTMAASQWMRRGDLKFYVEAGRSSGTADFAELDNINPAPAGGHTIPVANAAETATGQTVGKTKRRTTSTAAGTETAQAVVRTKRRTSGTTSETSSAQTAGRKKTRALGPAADAGAAQHLGLATGILRAAETDSAQPAGKAKHKALGAAIETDTGQAAGKAKRRTSPTAAAADTGQVLARRKTRTLGPAVETDAAQQTSHPAALTSASETDGAQSAVRAKTRTLSPATETGTAQPLQAAHTARLGTAVQADAGQPVRRVKDRTAGPAAGTDAAQALVARRARPIGPAISDDRALQISRNKVRPLHAANEADEAQSLTGGTAHLIGGAAETSNAQPLPKAKTKPLTAVLEGSSGQMLHRGKRKPLDPAAETGQAQATRTGTVGTLTAAAETATAPGIRRTKTLALVPALERDTAQAPAGAAARNIEIVVSEPHTRWTTRLAPPRWDSALAGDQWTTREHDPRWATELQQPRWQTSN